MGKKTVKENAHEYVAKEFRMSVEYLEILLKTRIRPDVDRDAFELRAEAYKLLLSLPSSKFYFPSIEKK